ncbi:ABC-2 type transport system ATP-binding protein [Seinonella peptonophila]|uniref:ABC-2 type transport system ATP-binding protein n=1 Tax=Seinonella peptonophila TaxID=112248 RepID=A0A1M4WMT9_9BACL|nr:ABC transporter ATP-binding protein [Seinonella peptonophila]SHE82480.1 ABC-2 type transport system ATP-binding protein [Seinonella peptonophila]
MIKIEGLRKEYKNGSLVALDNLHLQIEQGTVFGFIGPNGAGKSTTMLILATLLTPTSGHAEIGGFHVVKQGDQVRRLIGYMPDFFGVYDNLTAYEYLEFYASCYGVDKEIQQRVITDLLELVNLIDKRQQPVDGLSRGMKQRLGLARSLVHDPAVLILDEPASGLDPRARIEFREVLKELRSMGKTIMISSHILPELADLCDTIGVMEHGKLIASGPVDQLIQKPKEERLLELRLLADQQIEEVKELLQADPNVQSVEEDQEQLLIQMVGNEQQQADILMNLITKEIKVVHFAEVSVNIEDVFLQVTEQREEANVNEHSNETI